MIDIFNYNYMKQHHFTRVSRSDRVRYKPSIIALFYIYHERNYLHLYHYYNIQLKADMINKIYIYW